MDKEKATGVGSGNHATLIVGGVVVAVVLLLGFLLIFKHNGKVRPVARGAVARQTAYSAPASGRQKLSDSSFAAVSYKIYPGTMSSQAKQAMTGFAMQTKTASDGSALVTLVANKSGYRTQTYTVKTGQSLYFIERMPRDDSLGQDTDHLFGDDTAVVVDANGYIVSQN